MALKATLVAPSCMEIRTSTGPMCSGEICREADCSRWLAIHVTFPPTSSLKAAVPTGELTLSLVVCVFAVALAWKCELTPICAWKAPVPEALPSAALAPVAEPAVPPSPVVAPSSPSAVPSVRFATTLSIVEPLPRETPSLEPLVVVTCPALGCCPPAIAATRDCDRKPKDAAVGSVSLPLAALPFPPLPAMPSAVALAVAVVAAVALSAALACDCASASMKLGPLAVPD